MRISEGKREELRKRLRDAHDDPDTAWIRRTDSRIDIDYDRIINLIRKDCHLEPGEYLGLGLAMVTALVFGELLVWLPKWASLSWMGFITLLVIVIAWRDR